MTGIERAKSIRGWMSERELEWLAGRAANASRIAEVGSAWGRSTRALADNTLGRVFAVDSWNGGSPADSALEAQVTWTDEIVSKVFAEDGGGEDVHRLFRANLADKITDGTVQVVRLESVPAARTFKDGSLDMVFIDASHDLASVAADIVAWSPKVKVGGILCGHDYDHVPWHEVRIAVNAAYGESRISVEDTIWWLHL